MNQKRTFLILSILIVSLIGIFYLLFPGTSTTENSSYQGGLSEETLTRQENSLFEGGSFLDFSGHVEETVSGPIAVTEEPNSKPSRTKSYLESLSPEERAKLYDRLYEKFKPLTEKFPNNSLIPKKLSEEELAKKKENEDNYYRIQREILERKDVPKEEMSFYLNAKLKRSDDMLEILKYGMENYQKLVGENPKNANPEYEKLIKERLDGISKSREEVISAQKGN
ncbi:hypothetical protein EHQ81_10710 [Leptospira selangorensis]|uniref:Uncharacterized protein n=1 Tax=Leptospira selangorensis TaxID=2484982 RepID=A0A4R9GFP2_9LEPT|nr:hypothetical protein [Leptospira selangorensis]TGK10447.1 hypothetical protein EHO58_00235 [Leptospira selangorensis]TGM13304.1 hypothetical protein EHQ81_10710 [Leptospira selangorensis]TGM22354.1 hypothetical protein EHQ82_08015 [Leptospira selangorensis]